MKDTTDKVADLRSDYLCWRTRIFDDCLALCESPIEQMFAAALLMYGFEPVNAKLSTRIESRLWREKTTGLHGGHLLQYPATGFWAMSQPRVRGRLSRYRCDFALWDESIQCAVELDGHAFHERTKEQASRDKSRDRDLAAAGWTVLRFTGSDVYRDVHACVSEVFDLLTPNPGRIAEGA